MSQTQIAFLFLGAFGCCLLPLLAVGSIMSDGKDSSPISIVPTAIGSIMVIPPLALCLVLFEYLEEQPEIWRNTIILSLNVLAVVLCALALKLRKSRSKGVDKNDDILRYLAKQKDVQSKEE